jgi:hypothetical protein
MHQDATNRPITKGSYIAYSAGAQARSYIKFGCVVALKEKVVERNVWNDATKSYDEVMETDYRVQVIVAERPSWGPNQGKWVIQGKVEGKLAKVQSIERLERVIVLEPHQMLPEAREVIDRELHERGQL